MRIEAGELQSLLQLERLVFRGFMTAERGVVEVDDVERICGRCVRNLERSCERLGREMRVDYGGDWRGKWGVEWGDVDCAVG